MESIDDNPLTFWHESICLSYIISTSTRVVPKWGEGGVTPPRFGIFVVLLLTKILKIEKRVFRAIF
jgi:hypothetical protein